MVKSLNQNNYETIFVKRFPEVELSKENSLQNAY